MPEITIADGKVVVYLNGGSTVVSVYTAASVGQDVVVVNDERPGGSRGLDRRV